MIDWNNATVLVTGGTGFFGQVLIDKLLKTCPPKKLIVFSRDECKQYEMGIKFNDRRLRFFLGDVRDKDRLYRALQGVDIVIHAAALKIVTAAEYNPFEFIKTNVLGAANIIDAAIDREVQKIIVLSTDKACNPISLYGATKLCADKLFITANAHAGDKPTRFSIVRYGNVIGSPGSVIPLFIKSRERGVLKLTDPRMTRFWITVERAVDFVLSCIENMLGGEIFVPKIPSMKLVDVAKVVAPDCTTEYIGIRPGDKLHETLVPKDEAPWCLEFDDHYIIQPSQLWFDSKPLLERGGKPVAEGFRYRSDLNEDWLNKEDLIKLLGSSVQLEPATTAS